MVELLVIVERLSLQVNAVRVPVFVQNLAACRVRVEPIQLRVEMSVQMQTEQWMKSV